MIKIDTSASSRFVALKYGQTIRSLVTHSGKLQGLFKGMLASASPFPTPDICEEIKFSYVNADNQDILTADSPQADTITAAEMDCLEEVRANIEAARGQHDVKSEWYAVLSAIHLPDFKKNPDFYRRCKEPKTDESRLVILWGLHVRGETPLRLLPGPETKAVPLIEVLPPVEGKGPESQVNGVSKVGDTIASVGPASTRGTPVWLWILLAFVLLMILFLINRGCSKDSLPDGSEGYGASDMTNESATACNSGVPDSIAEKGTTHQSITETTENPATTTQSLGEPWSEAEPTVGMDSGGDAGADPGGDPGGAGIMGDSQGDKYGSSVLGPAGGDSGSDGPSGGTESSGSGGNDETGVGEYVSPDRGAPGSGDFGQGELQGKEAVPGSGEQAGARGPAFVGDGQETTGDDDVDDNAVGDAPGSDESVGDGPQRGHAPASGGIDGSSDQGSTGDRQGESLSPAAGDLPVNDAPYGSKDVGPEATEQAGDDIRQAGSVADRDVPYFAEGPESKNGAATSRQGRTENSETAGDLWPDEYGVGASSVNHEWTKIAGDVEVPQKWQKPYPPPAMVHPSKGVLKNRYRHIVKDDKGAVIIEQEVSWPYRGGAK